MKVNEIKSPGISVLTLLTEPSDTAEDRAKALRYVADRLRMEDADARTLLFQASGLPTSIRKRTSGSEETA